MKMYEWLLSLFAFLNFSVSFTWLLYLYYELKAPLFVDNFGVLAELFALFLPLAILLEIQIQGSKAKQIARLSALMLAIGLGIGHYWLSDAADYYLFHPYNTQFKQNIFYQLCIDLLLFVLFFWLFFRKNDDSKELFDGAFKRYFGIVFFAFYIQDIIILSMMLYSEFDEFYRNILTNFSLILTLLLTIVLGLMAIATNYLQIWHQIVSSTKKQQLQHFAQNTQEPFHLDSTLLYKLQAPDWNQIKQVLGADCAALIKEIDGKANYTKTEKLYCFLNKFELSHKEIADLLSVSIRTVETNFYRLRQKVNQ